MRRSTGSYRTPESQSTSTSSIRNFEPFSNFKEWVQANKSKNLGVDCDGNPAPYFSDGDLRKYWNKARVGQIVESLHPPLNVRYDDLQNKYPRILSVLAYNSTRERLYVNDLALFCRQDFDDDCVSLAPSHGRATSPYSDAPGEQESHKAFVESQWLFFPLGLDYLKGQVVDKRCVLQADLKDIIGGGDTSQGPVLRRVRFHGATKDVVLKQYQERDSGRFQCEAATYVRVSSVRNSHHYFPQYFGSFIQNGTYTLALEYAPRGSLLDLFRTEGPPTTHLERVDFLKSLVAIFGSLKILHSKVPPHRPCSGSVKANVQISHNDVKPANILVFDKGNPTSRFDFKPKLADLDRSHRQPTHVGSGDPGNLESGSSHTYGAPETYRSGDAGRTDNLVYSSADNWSAGCVLLDGLVWSFLGEHGRSTMFCKYRFDETKLVGNLHNDGYAHAFHNGVRSLVAIKDILDLCEKAEGIGRDAETISKQVGTYILRNLLVEDPQYRNDAAQFENGLFALECFQNRDFSMNSGNNSKDTSSFNRPELHLPSASAGPSTQPLDPNVGPLVVPNPASPSTPHPALGLESHYERFGWDSSPVIPYGPGLSIFSTSSPGSSPGGDMAPPPSPVRSQLSCPISGHPLNSGKAGHSLVIPSTHSPTPSQEGRSPDTGPAPNDPIVQHPQDDHRQGGIHKSNYAKVQIREVDDWIKKRKGRRRTLLPCLRQPQVIDLPDRKIVLGKLSGRIQYFLIDDSSSMAQHWVDVVAFFYCMRYLLKNTHPRGIQLRFTSNPNQVYQGRTSSAFARILNDHDPNARSSTGESRCIIQDCIDECLTDIMRRLEAARRRSVTNLPSFSSQKVSCKGFNFYVLTDGVWGRSPGLCRADEAIISRVGKEQLNALGLGATKTMIQFVRFGEDPTGRNRMKQLDDNLAERMGHDIVDSKPWKGSIWSIMIGSMCSDEDGYSGDDDPGGNKHGASGNNHSFPRSPAADWQS